MNPLDKGAPIRQSKRKKKGPQAAGSNAQLSNTPVAKSLSPTSSKELPAAQQNINKPPKEKKKKKEKKGQQTTTLNTHLTNNPITTTINTPVATTLPPNNNKDSPTVIEENSKSPNENPNSSGPEFVSDLSFTFIDTISKDNTPVSSEEMLGLDDNHSELHQHLACLENMTGVRPSVEVGDNKGRLSPTAKLSLDSTQQSPINPQQQIPTGSLVSKPEDPWHLTYNELKIMRARMGTLENVEEATLEFAQRLQALTNRAATNETKISQNTDEIKGLKEEIAKLRDKVDSQQNTISNMNKIKDDFSQKSHRIVSEMNTLLEQQGQQVESLKIIRRDIKIDTQNQKDQLETFKACYQESQEHIEQQIKDVNTDRDHKSLTDQVFQNRHNIIITGLPEDNSHSTYSIVTKFFKEQLKLKKLRINATHRLGRAPFEGNPYTRPILVKFAILAERNMVWRMRRDVPTIEGQPSIKIQADLPKKLRDGLPILYKISKAASNMEEFKSLRIRDYAIILNDKQYTLEQLELLPPPLRPSSLAVREADDAMIFFSKSCFLSNHFPATFNLEGYAFQNMEHYLAFQRAKLSQRDDIIERALEAKDPVQAKSILNLLRDDHLEEWKAIRQEVALTGLRAKFKQNQHLADSLKDTSGLRLGEASKNSCWGIGFTLEDPQALDTSQWNETGNLLGNSLMQVRTEITGST